MQIANSPQDITRLGNLEDISNYGWAKIPVYYHYAFQAQLPLSEDEFNRLFVQSMRLFLQNVQTESCPGVVTNADFSTLITNEPFLLTGIGVMAMGEGLSFAQDGEVWPDSDLAPFEAEGAPVAPRIFSCVRAQSGQNRIPSKLWYGGPTWRLIEKFFQAKRFSLRVGRCEIVNESLLELGMIYAPPVFKGASSSEIPTMCFVSETNAIMRAKGLGFGFLPVNTSVVDSATGGVFAQTNGACAPNAGVTYGHPEIPHLANRIYCLPRPLLITPFMPSISMEFETVDNDCCLIPAARKAATLCCETPFPNWPALTVDETSTASCSVPGGCVTLGIVLKGFTCLPQVVAQYLCHIPDGLESIYANQYVAGIVNKFNLHKQDNLKGLVENLRSRGTART